MKFCSVLLLFFITFSCQKKEQEVDENQTENSQFSVVQTFKKPEKVQAQYQKEVENWSEYRNLSTFFRRLEKTSPREVLSNALELEGLLKNLKDSVTPDLFDIDAFKARVNVLYNESLRLSDMTKIPAISADEVITQTTKIINAFSAVNSKINTILTKKNFEDAITIDVKYIGLDSTKLDSTSRKNIKKISTETEN